MYRFLNKKEYFRCYKSIFLHGHLTLPIQSFRYKCHYTSLGLDSTASQKDIKSAYYQLSLKFHPDKNDGSPESVEKFRQIAEAYEVLGNPDKKKVYDRDFTTGTNYGNDFQRDRRDNRTGYYYRSSSTRSGRDQFYNYEEHIRQHYEKFYRERQFEQEDMRRRWEADNRFKDKKHWSTYRQPPPPPGMAAKEFFASKSFRYLVAFWSILVIMGLFTDGDSPKQNKPLYYNVNVDRNKPIYYDVKKDEKSE